MKIIDPHIHLFDLANGDYHWLQADNAPFWPKKNLINRNFNEQDLALAPNTVMAGFVHIEAGFDNERPWRELAWLENNCQSNFRAIAGIDLTLAPETFKQHIQNLQQYSSFVGCRHILDENASVVLSHENTLINFTTLAENQLIFELQMPLTDNAAVSKIISILNHLPTLSLIINHAGWPFSEKNAFTQTTLTLWQKNLKRFSPFNLTAIKCSGWEMSNMAINEQTTKSIIINCIKACLDTLGLERVMLASNFPLCLFNGSYEQLWQFYLDEVNLTEEQLEKICYKNSYNWYKFS